MIARFFRLAAAGLLAGALLAPAASFAQSYAPTGTSLDPFLGGVRRTVLPNGLTLLVRPQPGSGVVAINTWVKAGYFHEPDEVAGMAHLFEHMFFKGSEKFPGAEQISQELGRVGGQTNAGTIYDSTNYYFVLPAENFARGVEIQADAIMNPLFDPAELKKEAEVVIEESNRKLDNPSPVSMERMFATAFTTHRMKRWRIGSNEVLRGIERQNLLEFFETLYRPENIILTITGDVTAERAEEVVRATFGRLPRGTLTKESGPAEPPQTEFRFGQSTADMKSGYSVLGWHTVPTSHEDEIALEVVADILGRGKSSRLYRGAIAPDAASTVTAFNWSTDEVGIFVVQTSFDEKNREEVDRRVLREVARLTEFGPTAYELQLAKNRTESDFAFGLEDVLGQAQALSYAEANYGYRGMGERFAALRALTPERVRDVARRHLRNESLTLYHYRPNGSPDRTRDAMLALVREATMTDGLAAETATPLPKIESAIAGASSAIAPREMKLANGITLVVEERPGAPVVASGIYFRGGRIGENSTNAGITELLTRVMRRGTKTRSAEQINREIEFLGTQIGATSPPDYFGFELGTLRDRFAAGLDILADVVLNPTFPEDGIREEKHLQAGAIKRSLDSSTARPFQLLHQTYYGNHPYALPSSGYLTSVGATDRDALVDWWRRWVVANDAVIVVVGDIAAADARKLIESRFAKLPTRSAALPAVPEVAPPASRLETIEYRTKKQSAIAVAYPIVPLTHDDWPVLRLMQNVVSGLAGTFFAELRGNRSLAYTVFGGESTLADAGVFIGYLASDVSKETDAKAALIAEFKRLDEGGFTEADLERAKAYFAGSTRIGRQRNGAHVDEIAKSWMFGVGLGFTDHLLELIPTITMERAQSVAKTYFDADDFAMAVVSGRAE